MSMSNSAANNKMGLGPPKIVTYSIGEQLRLRLACASVVWPEHFLLPHISMDDGDF